MAAQQAMAGARGSVPPMRAGCAARAIEGTLKEGTTEAAIPTWRVEIEFLTGVIAESGDTTVVAERDLATEEMRLIVGRSPDADITIPDGTVSRRHCALQLTPDGALLIDLGSSGGTYVNGERVKEQQLAVGDKFIVGANSMAKLIASDVS
jgi:pSer/pThr/pTyr-binding forkhead associated (FHA) protein